MNDLIYLSIQYIRYHKIKLLVLTFAVTLVSWLPLAMQSIVDQTATQLMERADTTPFVIGAPGSRLELSLGSLYFQTQYSNTFGYGELAHVESTGYARAIPLHYRFHAQGTPIVGTSMDYFEHRRLRIDQGRQIALLGEAVLGADVATTLQLSVGDYVISSPESVFDIAGVYPLKMKVVGIFEPSFSPDDKAIFVDIKTSWVIQGLGHGHQELANKQAVAQILKKEGNNIIANASVHQYNEITPDNIDSFHFHGDNVHRPLSAIIPVPHDKKSEVMLLGHYLERAQSDQKQQTQTEGEHKPYVQIVRTSRVIGALLDTVFTVRDYIIVGITVVAGATVMIACLVFYLSLRLRSGERFTLARIGGATWQIGMLMAIEVLSVLVCSALLVFVLMSVTEQYGIQLLQGFLLS